MNKHAYIIAIGIWALYTGLVETHGADWLFSFRSGALGDLSNVVVPYWALFLAWFPAKLPEPLGFAIWTGVGMTLVVVTAQIMQVPLWQVLCSYQLHWILFYGQIDPFVVFGLGLGYWAVQKNRPYLLGLAIMLVLIKPQVGLLPALAFARWSSDLRKTLVVAGIIVLASLVVWPNWVFDLIQNQWIGFVSRTESINANTSANLPLWLSLPLTAGVLFSQLERKRKIIALVAATMLLSHYATIYSQLALLVLGLPAGFVIFSLLPWLVAILYGPFNHWDWAVLFPLSALIYCYRPYFAAAIKKLRDRRFLATARF